MDSSQRCTAPIPCSHHHQHHNHTHFLYSHHHHHHYHCHRHPLNPFPHHHHHHHLHHHHCSNQHVCPRFAHLPHFQNPVPVASVPSPKDSNLQTSVHDSGTLVYQEHEQDEFEEEEDEEPIFVLTDEWKEFFAKSDAKRKLEKKQAKKKGKA